MNALTSPLSALAAMLIAGGLLTTSGVEAGESTRTSAHAARLVSAFRDVPEQELKSFYRNCSRAAVAGSLSSGEIALCSIGYEVLLQRAFDGDFRALLAWSRSQPRAHR